MLVLFNPGTPPEHQQWIEAGQIVCMRPAALRRSSKPLRPDQEKPDLGWVIQLEMSSGQMYSCEYPSEELAKAVQQQFVSALDGLLEVVVRPPEA